MSSKASEKKIGLGRLNKSHKVDRQASIPDHVGHGSLDDDGLVELGGGDSFRQRRLKQAQLSSDFRMH